MKEDYPCQSQLEIDGTSKKVIEENFLKRLFRKTSRDLRESSEIKEYLGTGKSKRYSHPKD